MTTRKYISLWNKYRPAILKMMLDAEAAPQSYQLSNHEFKSLAEGKKDPFVFNLTVAEGKAVKGLKNSLVAQDLWEILQMSRKGSELISAGGFEISMDRQFVLHVHKTQSTSN
jgi:hypothetical protein